MSTTPTPGSPTTASTRLRVTRHGYDPDDVHALMGAARARLCSLAERLARAEAANRALRADLARWQHRAREATDRVGRLEGALAAAESTVATSLAEVQVRADHLVERARAEAEHLRLQAEERARRLHDEVELARLSHEAASWFGAEVADLIEDGAVLDLTGDDAGGEVDPRIEAAFARFMSEDVADEPSRGWVLGDAAHPSGAVPTAS